MNEKKLFIIIGIATILILVVGVFFLSSSNSLSSQTTASSKVKAIASETNYDWGKIDYNGPKATKTFVIKNKGSENLKLFNVKTSCHCTKAHISIDGTDSPDFGMSGASSWIGEVKPGKEAKLVIIFDQSYHGPEGVGQATRYTSVETNDSSNSKISFTTSGNVVR